MVSYCRKEVESNINSGKKPKTYTICNAECWSALISKGKINLQGDDHILVPKGPEVEGHLNFTLLMLGSCQMPNLGYL